MRHRARVALLGVVLASVVAGVACANISVPPGGPEDRDAPSVVSASPQAGAVGVRPKSVVLQFDEVIAETPRGATDLQSLVFVSPKAGPAVVDWGRTRLSIRPRKGWKANTVYSITIAAGIADLRGNSIDSVIRVVFSTGGAIPQTHITGVVFDWIVGKGAPKAVVEAIAKDSTTYQVLADSAGRYDLSFLPPGPYVVRAFTDKNTNRDLDPTEAWDTVSVTLTSAAALEFYAFPHDTVGLRISEVAVADSNRVLRVVFDKPYASTHVFVPAQFSVKGKDSTRLTIASVQTLPQRARADSLARQAQADSARAKADTSAAARARADAAARKARTDSLLAAERADREARRLAQLRGGRPLPVRDTTPAPAMKRPVLYSEVYVTLAQPLAPASSYRVQVDSVRSLSGTVRSPARVVNTAKPTKRDSVATTKVDTTKVDTTAKRPPAVRRDTLGTRSLQRDAHRRPQ